MLTADLESLVNKASESLDCGRKPGRTQTGIMKGPTGRYGLNKTKLVDRNSLETYSAKVC